MNFLVKKSNFALQFFQTPAHNCPSSRPLYSRFPPPLPPIPHPLPPIPHALSPYPRPPVHPLKHAPNFSTITSEKCTLCMFIIPQCVWLRLYRPPTSFPGINSFHVVFFFSKIPFAILYWWVFFHNRSKNQPYEYLWSTQNVWSRIQGVISKLAWETKPDTWHSVWNNNNLYFLFLSSFTW